MSQNIECFDAADSTAAPLQPRRTSDRAGGRTTHRASGAPHGNTRDAASIARLEEDKGEEGAESSGSDESEDDSDFDGDGDSSSDDVSDDEVEVVSGTSGRTSTATQAGAAATAEPAAKKQKTRTKAKTSAIWADFTLDPEDRKVAYCNICPRGGKKGRVSVVGGSTSSMHKHMNQVHSSLMASRGAVLDPGQQRMDDKVVVAPGFLHASLTWMLMSYSVRVGHAVRVWMLDTHVQEHAFPKNMYDTPFCFVFCVSCEAKN